MYVHYEAHRVDELCKLNSRDEYTRRHIGLEKSYADMKREISTQAKGDLKMIQDLSKSSTDLKLALHPGHSNSKTGTRKTSHLDLLPLQVIDSHISPNSDPPPPEPNHLTLMAVDHSRQRSQPLIYRANKQQPHRTSRSSGLLLPRPRQPSNKVTPHTKEHGYRRIKHPRILAEHRRRSESIQRDRRSKTRLILHQRADEVHSAVVQRAVIRMVTDAMLVEGNDDIDSRGGSLITIDTLSGQLLQRSHFRRESRG